MRIVRRIAAALLLLAVWVGIKEGFEISDRYLPGPVDVLLAWQSVSPSVLIHAGASWLRLIVGFSGGSAAGILLGIAWWRSPVMFEWTSPSVQAVRAVPATATIPFFLLWFGFAETGRFLLILMGVGLNVAIATHQALEDSPRRYTSVHRSFGLTRHDLAIRDFALQVALGALLPTLRFALATAIGLVVVSEILGSQTGLGYLIQSARSTFSLNLVFLAATLFGVINSLSDLGLRMAWRKVVFWQEAR